MIRYTAVAAIYLLTAGVSSCATGNLRVPTDPAPPPPVASRSVSDANDYFQLVVRPRVERPAGAQIDCRLRDSEAARGLEGWARDYWLNIRNRDIQAGVSVTYETTGGDLTHSIPVIALNASNGGRKCKVETVRVPYVAPLMLASERANVVFALTTRHVVEEQLDDSLLGAAQVVVRTLTAAAGAPEPVANAVGGFARNQLQDHAHMQPSSTDTVTLGLAPGLAREENITLVDLNTRVGRLNAGVSANFQFIGSAIYPMVDAVPDLSAAPPTDFLRWQIGRESLEEAVNAATDRGWARYRAATDVIQLNAICQDVRSRLGRAGFSSADSTALAWIMTQTHENTAARDAMRRPACLTGNGQGAHLARFGIALPTPTQPTIELVASSLNADNGHYRRFFAPQSDVDLEVLSRRLFKFDAASPTTQDADGVIFVRGINRVPSAANWNAYLPSRPILIQCLTVVDDSNFGGIAALAIGKTAAGVEIPIVANFADLLPGETAQISRLAVIEEARRERAYALIRSRWAAHCETADARPQVIFGAT